MSFTRTATEPVAVKTPDHTPSGMSGKPASVYVTVSLGARIRARPVLHGRVALKPGRPHGYAGSGRVHYVRGARPCPLGRVILEQKRRVGGIRARWEASVREHYVVGLAHGLSGRHQRTVAAGDDGRSGQVGHSNRACETKSVRGEWFEDSWDGGNRRRPSLRVERHGVRRTSGSRVLHIDRGEVAVEAAEYGWKKNL